MVDDFGGWVKSQHHRKNKQPQLGMHLKQGELPVKHLVEIMVVEGNRASQLQATFETLKLHTAYQEKN